MKKLFLLFFCCVLSLSCFAQKQGATIQMISLKDGSSIMGEIIEDANGYILLEIVGGEQIKLYHKYIKKISRSRPNHYFLDNGKSFRDKGYFATFQIGNAFGSNGPSSHLHLVFGKYYQHKWAFGLGIGLDIHSQINTFNPYVFTPVYLHARGYPFDFKVSPYYAFSLGYGFPIQSLNGSVKGGIMFNPAIGLRFASRRKSTFFLEMGNIIQDAYGDYTSWWGNGNTRIKEDITFKRLKFTLGWIF